MIFLMVPIVLAWFYFVHFQNISFLEASHFKIFFTWGALWVEEWKYYHHFQVWGMIFSSYLLGFPTIYGLFAGILFWGPIGSFFLTLFAQVIASWIVLKKGKPTEKGFFRLEKEVVELVRESSLSAAQLAFFPRLFVAIPLRTIDQMVALTKPDRDGVGKYLFISVLGTGIRLLFESIWANTLVFLVVDFRPFPDSDLAWFLTSTAVLIFSYLFPKIPEFVPGKAEIKKFFQTLSDQVDFTPSIFQKTVTQ